MGRYSSDSEGSHYSRHSKKKKKHRSRSSSPKSDESRSRHKKRTKEKKSKQKQRSRSRSGDRSYKRRRSRSRSYGRRSRSRGRRSRSVEIRQRRRSRSRSKSPRRRRRSRSSSRNRSRRSSRDRSHSRDRKYRDRDSYRDSNRKETKATKTVKEDPCASIPGFDDMTPSQQSEVRMMIALKAAAAADEKLKEQGCLEESTRVGGTTLTVQEQQIRAKAIEEIESDGFAPAMFSSNRTQKQQPAPSHPSVDVNHETAMFSMSDIATVSRGVIYKDHDCLLHTDFQKSYEERMSKWITKLEDYRRKKLEGEVMS